MKNLLLLVQITIVKTDAGAYSNISDRVTETCEARNLLKNSGTRKVPLSLFKGYAYAKAIFNV